MERGDQSARHLIIGGTVKGGTSSLFAYLSAHPAVCGSSVKETFFFSQQVTGVPDVDLPNYLNYFSPESGNRVFVEASPNYLGYKEDVAPAIRGLLPDAKILFVLRDPVDRLYSHYHFAKAKFELDEHLDFEEYVRCCEHYSMENVSPEEIGMFEKHVRGLEIGKYGEHLRRFLKQFPEEQVKVVFFDDLRGNPIAFISDICQFADIDSSFYERHQFSKTNVTFSGRNRLLHRIALRLNITLEASLRRRPVLKQRLVSIYKRMNQRREGYDPMGESTRARLAEFYVDSNKALAAQLPDRELPNWLA